MIYKFLIAAAGVTITLVIIKILIAINPIWLLIILIAAFITYCTDWVDMVIDTVSDWFDSINN